jgi:hypothetical protein
MSGYMRTESVIRLSMQVFLPPVSQADDIRVIKNKFREYLLTEG